MTNVGGDEASEACERIVSRLIVGFKRGRLTAEDNLATRPAPPQPDIALETLTPLKATTGFGHVRTNTTAADTPLRLDGVLYHRGVGVHANSVLEYDVKPVYERFVGQVGIDDKQMWHGTIVVKVFAGKELLHESPVLRGETAPWGIDVPLPKSEGAGDRGRLRLVVDGTRDGISWDLTNWIHAGFITRRGGP